MKYSVNHDDIYGIFPSDRARRREGVWRPGSFAGALYQRREEDPPVTLCSSLPDLIWPEVIKPNGNFPETSNRVGPKLPPLRLLAENN